MSRYSGRNDELDNFDKISLENSISSTRFSFNVAGNDINVYRLYN